MSEIKEKTKCPGCGKSFLRLASHLKYCKANELKKIVPPPIPTKVEAVKELVVIKAKKKSFLEKLRARLRDRSHKKA